jgi:hypothetical protein
MLVTSARFLDAIRHPPRLYVRVEVWLAGSRVDTYGVDGIPVYGGEVDGDASKQVRRTLNGVTVDATDEMWDLLSPVGTQLRVFRGFRYLNGEVEAVPAGVFVMPGITENYGGDWGGQIGTASDQMLLVQRARFTSPRAIQPGIRIADVVATLMAEVLGPVNNLSTSRALTGAGLLYARDRGAAITELANSIAADVYCAADGTPTIRDAPQLAATSVWTVDAGDAGVLYTAARKRTYDRTYSGVQAAPAQIDGSPPFNPVTVWDTDPDSPTYYLGPFGAVPYFFTSPLLANSGQAFLAAQALLPKVTAARAQLSLVAECNPALEDGDTITVVLPPRQPRVGTSTIEQHLISTFTIPLTPDGTQKIETASATADLADSE